MRKNAVTYEVWGSRLRPQRGKELMWSGFKTQRDAIRKIHTFDEWQKPLLATHATIWGNYCVVKATTTREIMWEAQ